MDLYDRVQFADGTMGLILSIKDKKQGNTAIFTILTDAYEHVICDPDQVGEINRRDVPMLKVESHETGGKIYKLFTSEINMLARYSMAVWHDYWTKQENNEHIKTRGILPMGVAKYPAYWTIYQVGNIEPLPVEKDIRRSEAVKPMQERMDIGGNRGH